LGIDNSYGRVEITPQSGLAGSIIKNIDVKFVKINKKRRNRGYNWENDYVIKLQELGWEARRLGGSSSGNPDVVATYHEKDANILYSCEFKSGFSNNLYVPYDQVIRCIKMANVFKAYDKRYIVLAFKFSNLQRHPFYWFFGFDMEGGYIDLLNKPIDEAFDWIRCSVKGHLVIKNEKGEALLPHTVKSQALPFPSHFLL
jgi:Holliday junction resolvase